jgi:hypothetical protein
MRALSLLLAPLLVAGCLPEDTRPPPAEVTVTVASSPLTTGEIPSSLTADGFGITIERFLVNLGEAELGPDDGTSCQVYSNPGYTRLFDFNRLEAPSTLGIAYATGECSVGFRVLPPDDSSIVDVGADASDDDFMRTPADDPDATNAGVSVYVEGEAVRNDQTFHFAWPFRKRIRYTGCIEHPGAPNDLGTLSLASGQKTTLELELHAEKLFQGDPTTPLHFEPFALADRDGDGEITFDELWSVGVEDFATSGLYVSPSAGPAALHASPCRRQNGDPSPIATLGDFVYCMLLPNIATYQGSGACSAVVGHDPGND